MWLIENAPSGFEQTPLGIANRVMSVNFAAIHTSSLVRFLLLLFITRLDHHQTPQTFTHALLHLAAHPEWAKPLREEVESIIADEGWTKASMQKMRKIDSFMRESSRVNALSLSESKFCNHTNLPNNMIMHPPTSLDNPLHQERIHILRWINRTPRFIYSRIVSFGTYGGETLSPS